jgi:GT2 family glycosyltransferase
LINSPKVAVVILNWNGKNFLQQFLPSVIKNRYENMDIIVADNASTDDSLSFLHEMYAEVKIISLDKNYGFAKGYNEALKKVKADYYVLLNSDAEVSENWIEPMVTLLESDKSIAACQPKVLSYQEKNVFDYAGAAGGWLDKFGYPFAKGRVFDYCEIDQGQYDQQEPIFWASGAAMFIRASAFHQVNGFDEYFFAHQEEIDLCWRLQLAGYQVYSCPAAKIYHVGGGTLPKGNSRKTYLNFRNNLIMIWKNLPLEQKLWKVPFRIILNAISAVKGLLSGDAGYFLAIARAHRGFVKWLFFIPKSEFPHKKQTRTLRGYYTKNLVWQHFVNKKKYFKEFVKY